ncbi:MAG: hypothetical protein ACRCU2_09120 [Planktothrix sp.]
MTIEAKKLFAESLKEKLDKSNLREPRNLRELANDIATLERVEEKQLAGDPLPPGYESYPEWLDTVGKEIGNSENSLEKIEDQKLMIETLDFYIATA